MEFKHISVLLQETVDSLKVKEDGIYIDCTIGGGGHSLNIAKLLKPEKGALLIGLDQDADAVAAATDRLKNFSGLLSIVQTNYANIASVCKELRIEKCDGILLDLGVSSYQLDEGRRGFSYMDDAPLDMRMDRRNPLSAYEVVNGYEEDRLFRIIKDYGEERYARRIAGNIVRAREDHPIRSTFELRDIVEASIPRKSKKTGGHPAKRTFQAVRIEVNQELNVLENTLDTMIDLLNPGGRISVITFHSLEDRIVKQAFKRNENPCTCPPDFPVCVCGKKPKGKIVTKKPILPSAEEMENNPRSKSAKLRVFERI
ncbi:MAG: 16S rRNA (cytosine(1402)-N(4))-methyltransferase RsmH [Lachnospiraceae bacterium]|nr:16S rRNA (cytosine(1402)-N(4))-methyltransferase RsmH [Lachnospiraceae bacterium]